MAHIEKFLGKRVEIPEDRRYVIKPGLWVRKVNQDLFFGFDEPSVVLSGIREQKIDAEKKGEY